MPFTVAVSLLRVTGHINDMLEWRKGNTSWADGVCRSGRQCTAALLQNLFQLLALSNSLKVPSHAACGILVLLHVMTYTYRPGPRQQLCQQCMHLGLTA